MARSRSCAAAHTGSYSGMAEALALDRHRRDEGSAASELRDPFELLDGERGFADRNMRCGKKPLPMARDQVEGPAVVSAAECVGQLRIVHLAFPDDAEAGIDDLARNSLRVEKARARRHVLQIGAVDGVAVEGADGAALFLLPIAAEDAEHFVDIAQLHRLAVHHHRALMGHGIFGDPDGALTEARFYMLLEQV